MIRPPFPSLLMRGISRAWPSPPAARVEPLTGLADSEWRRLAESFPLLGPDPGRDAARSRRTFTLVAWNELSRRRPRPEWNPAPPSSEPQVLVTAHIGNLRLLRYFLRVEGIPVATIVDETHPTSGSTGKWNEWIDRRFPIAFPHTFPSDQPHRLRAALRRGSLLAAIDRIHRPPPGGRDRSARVPFLGGAIAIELGALRLARLAGVAARPIFVTAPAARLTITVGAPLPQSEAEAVREFGAIFDRVSRESPGDFDGYTHRYLAGAG
ncbi:MAG TPA: hypothetical protein VFS34_08680 [Thermoanaerobaculia bacterium]|nr:hypothetical protein [Thermoanaerobaculia bacterium]